MKILVINCGSSSIKFQFINIEDESIIVKGSVEKIGSSSAILNYLPNKGQKVKIVEEVDRQIPRILSLNPDVIIVTGDHSTPALLKSHSWHPVPLLIWSKICRTDNVKEFGERACITGGLGPRLSAVEILPIALANAKRLEKFGA